MFERSVRDSWERFGRHDPYFGVLNAPRFHEAGRAGAARTEFFATGEEHTRRLFATIRESLCPEYTPVRALDFGCGVGRILVPIARRVPEVWGIDISPSMLAEARRNCLEAGFDRVALEQPSYLDACTHEFDFIHSYIVFQHIPERMGLRMLRTLLRRLAPGGVGALHFVYASRLSRWRRSVHWLRKRVPLVHPALNLVQGRALRSPLMQMNCYDLNRVLGELQDFGCHRVVMRFSDHGGWLGAFVLFQRRVGLDRRVC